jgi:hypothetical protein
VVIAFLIAFIAYENPVFSLPVGGALVALGLVYNLSKMNFVSMLGDTLVREAVIFVFIFLFTILPIIFHKHKAAIAINFGIIAAILLFFSQTYFLAIPLIFASIMIFKKTSFLTVVYYGFISVPFEMMQYLRFIEQIPRPDWWVEPGSSPPIFVPLNEIFKEIQESMIQFRLYDTSKVVYTITGQVSSDPPLVEHTVGEVLSHYLDSVPGIVLFLIIVAVLVSAFALLTRAFLRQSHVSHGERLLPTLTATVATLLFFICAGVLQGPLAFVAQIDGSRIAIGTFAALLFTVPALFMDQTPKRKATVEMISEKAKDLMAKLEDFQAVLSDVKGSVPIDVSSLEGKTLIIKDKLNDTLSKTSTGFIEVSEMDDKFDELEKLGSDVDNLTFELDVSTKEYHLFVNGEYSTWIGRFKDIGLAAETSAKKDFQKELPLKERIDRIKETLDGSRALATEVNQVAEQVYNIVRSLYNPNLPEESQAMAFAKKKLDENADPWAALDVLFVALNNWRKQYQAEISRSVEYLKTSLTSLTSLRTQSTRLESALGDKSTKMMDVVKRAEDVRLVTEKEATNVTNVIAIRDVLQSSLGIAEDALTILNEELKSKEESIESLLPTEDYPWEKNTALRERIASSMEILLNSSKYAMKQALENLPKSVSYVDECITTIARYKEQEELFLNYPVAETAIEDLLKQQTRISARELPFEPRHAEEYLRLFHSKKFRDVSFDDAKVQLIRKP